MDENDISLRRRRSRVENDRDEINLLLTTRVAAKREAWEKDIELHSGKLEERLKCDEMRRG